MRHRLGLLADVLALAFIARLLEAAEAEEVPKEPEALPLALLATVFLVDLPTLLAVLLAAFGLAPFLATLFDLAFVWLVLEAVSGLIFFAVIIK